MDTNVEQMIEYCTGIAKEFEAKLNRIRTYIPNHSLTSGTANEIILRNFLANLSNGRNKVGQGFICNPTNPDYVSKQCDILLYNHHDYPLVYSEGEVVLVFPQAARMVIEVKTQLNKKSLGDALENIRVAKQCNRHINGVIFAYDSLNPDTLLQHLRQFSSSDSREYAPIAILLFEKSMIIHRWPGTELGGSANAYEVRECKDRNKAIVVAFLLMLFFDVEMETGWGGASIMNMMTRLLEGTTTQYSEDILIGSV